MCARVREARADLGIALDGDADRLVLADQNGELINGDQVLAVLARLWKENDRLTKPGIVATVMSNLGLERWLNSEGLTLARTQVGDRYVSAYMREHGFNVGGESSGHIVLSDFAATGDGLISALQILSTLKRGGRPASEVCRIFDPVPQIMESIEIKNANGFMENDQVVKLIDSARERLGKQGRLLVRKSGTEPLIRIMGEAENTALLHDVVGELADALSQRQSQN